MKEKKGSKNKQIYLRHPKKKQNKLLQKKGFIISSSMKDFKNKITTYIKLK